MPVRPVPPNPSLDHLKHQAKDLLKALEARDPAAAQRVREFHPRFSQAADGNVFAGPFKLSDAQLTIARESGFPSWPRLKRHIDKPTLADQLNLPHHERIEDPVFRRAVDLLDAGDVEGLGIHLRNHPGLSRQHVLFEGGNYFRRPTLLEFVAENPTRHGTLPDNIVEVTKAILDAGVTSAAVDETLELVASSNVAHQRGVQGALIDLLCDHGADPNRALRTAAMQAEFEATDLLLRRGAHLDMPAAAALGRTADAQQLLPSANADDRHLAIALASQFGHLEIVRMLLDAGEDPSRYNPVGGHSHSTPLHQAALAGHLEVAELLLKYGARLDFKDTMWQGTPADWARYAGKQELEEYLRSRERSDVARS
jgi:hypothetical protein